MRKTLAVLATVAAVGAAAMTAPAPAEARGIGPGLAFGLAAGALTAGAIAATHPYYGLWLRLRTGVLLCSARLLRAGLRLLWRRPLLPSLLSSLVTPVTCEDEARGSRSGLFRSCHDQNGSGPVAQALRKVVTKYSSRSRSNFSCVALKLATLAAISARSFASRSCACSVMPIPYLPRIFRQSRRYSRPGLGRVCGNTGAAL